MEELRTVTSWTVLSACSSPDLRYNLSSELYVYSQNSSKCPRKVKTFPTFFSLLFALYSLFRGPDIVLCVDLLGLFLSSHVVLFGDPSTRLLWGRDIDEWSPLWFQQQSSLAGRRAKYSSRPLDAGLRAGEFLSGSSGLQLGVTSSTLLSSSVLRPRGLGLEMLDPHHPSNPRGQRGTERGRREQQRRVFCCCTRRAP